MLLVGDKIFELLGCHLICSLIEGRAELIARLLSGRIAGDISRGKRVVSLKRLKGAAQRMILRLVMAVRNHGLVNVR